MPDNAHDCQQITCPTCIMERRLKQIWDYAQTFLSNFLDLDEEGADLFLKSLPSDGMDDQIYLLTEIDQYDEIPAECPDGLIDYIWDILVECDNSSEPHPIRMLRVQLLAFILQINDSYYYLHNGDLGNSILAYGQANLLLGSSSGRLISALGKGSSYNIATLGAQSKLKSDPKQAAKKLVLEIWEKWRKEPNLYKSKAAFARDMLDKFEELSSQRVIERWCLEWESVSS